MGDSGGPGQQPARNPYQFESLESLRTRLAQSGRTEPVRVVIFGGTGAVGGAVLLDLVETLLDVANRRKGKPPLPGEILATGMSNKDIRNVAERLFLKFESHHIDKVKALREYVVGGLVTVRFDLFMIRFDREALFQEAARAFAEAPEPPPLRSVLRPIFEVAERPLLDLCHAFGQADACVMGIPLPSVMAYGMRAIDELVTRYGGDAHAIKGDYLDLYLDQLATIQQEQVRQLIIAHTTAVGGMYRVDHGPEIRLGFAHSSSGELLKEKKYFADLLTREYARRGFKVLITAAAIGIDNVFFHVQLPQSGAVRALYRERQARLAPEEKWLEPHDLEGMRGRVIGLYPAQNTALELKDRRVVAFGRARDLFADVAIRSGENGLFSVDNCVALYNVMKVTLPEELATTITRPILYGTERHRDWFQNGIAYYTETENARFALAALRSDARLWRSQLGALSVKAYQALGSAAHQARLHELGMYILLLRLRSLRLQELDAETVQAAVRDLDTFLWDHSQTPYFEDLLEIPLDELERSLGEFVEVGGRRALSRLLLGEDITLWGRRNRDLEQLLSRLGRRVSLYFSTICSLGIPIIYRSPTTGNARLLYGPYLAPLDLAVACPRDMREGVEALAARHHLPYEPVWDWVVVNNGFVDLRRHAIATTARDIGPDLPQRVQRFDSEAYLGRWLKALPTDHYFTTGGLVATRYRLRRLWEKVRERRVSLGTAESWKNLFPRDANGKFVLTPGLIETVRMYNEGLGKVSGTESLWPGFGY